MAYSAKILLDSITEDGNRLTTFELVFPRFILPQINTHRSLSKSVQSSRAIPLHKTIEMVENDPFVPIYWGENGKGMVAKEEIKDTDKAMAKWLEARDNAVKITKELVDLKVHKQTANRLLEPFMWSTMICSGTDYENFFALRCDENSQPEINKIACMMRDLYYTNTPQKLKHNEWHLPLVTDFDESELRSSYSISSLRNISAGRCGRASYLTHLGKRDPEEDIKLSERLLSDMHSVPFEHQACASTNNVRSGNFQGFIQNRKLIAGENRSYSYKA